MIFLLLLASTSVVVVNCYPKLNEGTKITFSDAKLIDYEKIKFNENEPEEGSPEYYDSHRWISVTREGIQHEGTLEEVMEVLHSTSSEDSGDTQTHGKGEDDDGSSTEPFRILSQALNEYNTAEKRSVIGTDQRQLVSPPNCFPYTAIGRVDIGCTGTFISSKTVLTSAHCVNEGSGGRWYKMIDFSRNKDCDNDQGVRYEWEKVVTYRGWTQNSDMSKDIAIIIYKTTSNVVMQFDALPSTSAGIINIAGYPGDKPGRCLWRSRCKLNSVTRSLILYPCDTAGGMSGSGVYKYLPYCNRRIIYGVHGYGVGNGVSMNKAVRITQAHENCIRSWISAFKG